MDAWGITTAVLALEREGSTRRCRVARIVGLEKRMRVGPSMIGMVGRTPVVQLSRVVPQDAADEFVKLEWFNPTGSYKDRMALAMIVAAETRGDLRPGMTVLEYTAGSTGSSLGFVCAAKGYKLRIVTSDAFAPEKLATMRAFGADLAVVESEGGREEGSPLTSPRGSSQRHASSPMIPRCTGRTNSTIPTRWAVTGGAGTRLVIFEPDSSPVITTGVAGDNEIDGIGIGMLPPLLNDEKYDEVRAISQALSLEMARRLAREEGLFAGVSTGLNVVGAIDLASEAGPGNIVVTVACDTGLKYLAGNLFGS